MEKLTDYLTVKGWKEDFRKTVKDFKDIGILAKRAFGFSHYGTKKSGGEMTSREENLFIWDMSALWFSSNQDFKRHSSNSYMPFGKVKIGFGSSARRFNDPYIPNKIPLGFN